MRIIAVLGSTIVAAMLHVQSDHPAHAAQPWCLTIETTECSQPSYEMCSFTARPENGYCHPNGAYRVTARAQQREAPRVVTVVRNPWDWGPWQYQAPAAPAYQVYAPAPVAAVWRPAPTYYVAAPQRARPAARRGGTWCLTIEDTDCSQPSYEMCMYSARPESGYCYPNSAGYGSYAYRPYDYRSYGYRSYASYARAIARMARAQHLQRDTAVYMMVARTDGAAPAVAPASRRHVTKVAVAHRSPATVREQSASADITPRANAVDGALEAFAAADVTVAVPAGPGQRGAADETSGLQRVKVAALTDTATDAVPEPVTRAKTPILGAAKPDGIPAINVVASCRAAASVLAGGNEYVVQCLASESGARDQLAREWAEFVPAERAACMRLTTMTGGGTYSGLHACLDLKRFARTVVKGEPAVHVAVR